MEDLSSIAAVLFDMDGTLVDSDAAVERAWALWANEHGVDPARVLPIAHGRPADQTVRQLLPDLPDEEVAVSAARQLALQYDDLSDVVITPGAGQLLAVLADLAVPWAVVTSADVRLAQARLGAVGIYAQILVTVEDVTAGKPDPEGYLLAARLIGVDASRCLVVEDAEPGVAAGQAASARVAALKGVQGDIQIHDLAELAVMFAGKHGS